MMDRCYRWICFFVLLHVDVGGHSPDYKYLDDQCGPESVVDMTQDLIMEYSSSRHYVPPDYRCQVSVRTRDRTRQIQLQFRYLDMLQSPNCAVVGLSLSEDGTYLTPKNGVCGSHKPSMTYRTQGDTVTIRLANTGQGQLFVEFELLLTSFYYANSNSSCKGDDFRCDNGICLSSQLTCDGYNDCGDNSDEVEGCGMTPGTIAAIATGTTATVVVASILAFCVRRRRRAYLRMAEVDANDTQEFLVEHMQSLNERFQIMETEQDLLKKTVTALEQRSERLDSHIRRKNLLFFGIPRTVTETPEQCEAKVREVIRADMGLNDEEATLGIESVQRLGGSSVMVRFLSLHHKRQVLSHAGSLLGKQVRVSEDYSQHVREVRRGLVELKNTYRAEGKRAVLRHDKLYTEFDVFTYDISTSTVKKVGRRGQRPSSLAHDQYLALNSQRLTSRADSDWDG